MTKILKFYQNLLDFFYYSQLKTQGLNSTKSRETPGLIPVEESIALMRALGFDVKKPEVIKMVHGKKHSYNVF